MATLKRVPIDASGPILSAIVANNDVVFRNIVRLYFHQGWKVWDATYGRGVFWKLIPSNQIDVLMSDIAPLPQVVLQADARGAPFAENTFDAMVFDPPYLLIGGLKTLKKSIDRGYRNSKRGFVGREAVLGMYQDAIDEAKRVLKPGGLMVTKSMMQVESGGVRPQTAEILNYALDQGYLLIDWMITVVKGAPTMRHRYQMHSRRNYSDFLILENRR